MKISLRAFAKVNWFLDIRGHREDGYHLLETVMQSVSLADVVTLEKKKSPGIELQMQDQGAKMPFLPPTQQNLAYKAAVLFQKELEKKQAKEDSGRASSEKPSGASSRKESNEGFCGVYDKKASLGVKIHLIKNIPSQAGLGGGSADAAAVLYGMNRLWGQVFSEQELGEMALTLGADVPFCLLGGACLAQGVGEILTRVQAREFSLLLVKPEGGASTAQIYGAYDEDKKAEKQEEQENPGARESKAVQKALREGDPSALAGSIKNALYPAASNLHPAIRQAKEAVEEQGGCRKAMMTGSGSAVFGLFGGEKEMQEAKVQMEMRGLRSWVLHTVRQGVEEIVEGEEGA